MEKTEAHRILRYENGVFKAADDVVVAEYTLALYVNGVHHISFSATPEYLRELVIGYLFCEAVISDTAELQTMTLDAKESRCDVTVCRTVKPIPHRNDGFGRQHASYAIFPDRAEPEPISGGTAFSVSAILREVDRFNEDSVLHAQTGGVHRAALCNELGTLFAANDISRHNAIDKTIGWALENNADLANCFVVTSGRAPGDMVRKLVNARVPMLIARGTATTAAIARAEALNLALLGGTKNGRFNVYAHSERVLLNE